MVKGCGLALVLLTGLVGGYMYWFDLYFKRPESLDCLLLRRGDRKCLAGV